MDDFPTEKAKKMWEIIKRSADAPVATPFWFLIMFLRELRKGKTKDKKEKEEREM